MIVGPFILRALLKAIRQQPKRTPPNRTGQYIKNQQTHSAQTSHSTVQKQQSPQNLTAEQILRNLQLQQQQQQEQRTRQEVQPFLKQEVEHAYADEYSEVHLQEEYIKQHAIGKEVMPHVHNRGDYSDYDKERKLTRIEKLVRSKSDLKRAIILKEVLDRKHF